MVQIGFSCDAVLIVGHKASVWPLQKRIVMAEKDLRIPKREQHDFSYLGIRKATLSVIYGTYLGIFFLIPLLKTL
jgi:hypothetical protein